MAQIDTTYFIRDISLAVDEYGPALNTFIATYEPEILRKSLGIGLYKDYLLGIAEVTPLAKWTDLRDGKEYVVNGVDYKWRGLVNATKESFIANYVWYKFVTSDYYQSGIRKQKSENSELINPRPQQARIYNQMLNWIAEMDHFINANIADYPNYLPETIKKVNIFNI